MLLVSNLHNVTHSLNFRRKVSKNTILTSPIHRLVILLNILAAKSIVPQRFVKLNDCWLPN